MITKLGILEGEILLDMDNAGKREKLKELPSYLNESRDFFFMAVGALVRHGLIFLCKKDGEFVVEPRITKEITLTVNDQVSIDEKLYENENEPAGAQMIEQAV